MRRPGAVPGVGLLLRAAPFKGAGLKFAYRASGSDFRPQDMTALLTSAIGQVGYTPVMAKLLFIPVSVGASLLAGTHLQEGLRPAVGPVRREEPPDSKHRDIRWSRLLLAGAIQGAVFRMVKEATDHGSRRAFYRTTGSWPGEARPDAE